MYPNVKNIWESQLRGYPTDELFFEESAEEDAVYTKEGREGHVDEGKMHDWEDGFMDGFMSDSSEDSLTDQPENPEEEYERRLNGYSQ
ncbi:MAG: hypothetical protein AB1668_07130 [Nanoarchaeota archaeon]